MNPTQTVPTPTGQGVTALLLVDPLNDFLSDDGKLWPYAREVAQRLGLRANLKRLLEGARAAGLPIVFVPHRKFEEGQFDGWKFINPTHERALKIRPFLKGSWGADYHPGLEPRPGEIVATEHWLHNGFANTDLAFQLQIRGVDRVLLAGMRVNTCIEATARHAVELGLKVTLVKDACGSFRWEEWVATVETNAPLFTHQLITTDEALQHMAGGKR